MPRRSRFLVAGSPHHLTQRGNHRACIFFSSGDRIAYLRLLRRHTERHAIEVAAYCLMPNHVHLILVPLHAEQLQCAMRAVHGQFAQRINRMREQTGHLWQGRYFSSPLDSNYFVNSVRYVELNPVRAGMVSKAEDYEWSSAAAHCGFRTDPMVTAQPRSSLLKGITDWSRWLDEGIPQDFLDTFRKNGSQNLPCGSDEYVAELEKTAGRSLRFRSAGRKPERKGDSHL